MAERVRDVGDPRRSPELARAAQPLLQVADDGLARDEEEVCEHVPRPDEEPLGPDERLDALPVGGPLLEMILDGDGLPIEGEGSKGGIALEQVQEPRDHRDQARPVALEALVPLAVPVGVRHHERSPPEPAADDRDRARRDEPGRGPDGDPAEDVERVMDADHHAGEGGGDPEQQQGHPISRRHGREGDGRAHRDRRVAGWERIGRRMRHERLGRREEPGRLGDRDERTGSLHDELDQLRHPPR